MDIREHLTAYAHGELSPDLALKVEQALAHDPSLKAELLEIEQLTSALRTATTVSWSKGRDTTLEALEKRRQRNSRWFGWPMIRPLLAGSAAVFVVAWAGLRWLPQPYINPYRLAGFRLAPFRQSTKNSATDKELQQKRSAQPSQSGSGLPAPSDVVPSFSANITRQVSDVDKAVSELKQRVHVMRCNVFSETIETHLNNQTQADILILVPKGVDPKDLVYKIGVTDLPDREPDKSEATNLGTMWHFRLILGKRVAGSE